jgi:hypothetical protein
VQNWLQEKLLVQGNVASILPWILWTSPFSPFWKRWLGGPEPTAVWWHL